MKVCANKMRLIQVMSNLIDNAVKFTSKGYVHDSSKRKETQGDKASLVVSVKDKRRGIDTELLPRLFTKLCQSLKSAQG